MTGNVDHGQPWTWRAYRLWTLDEGDWHFGHAAHVRPVALQCQVECRGPQVRGEEPQMKFDGKKPFQHNV